MTHPLKQYRADHALTQGQLAEVLGVSDATITHIENGRRRVTPENAIEWEEKIGIPRARLCPKVFAKVGAGGTAKLNTADAEHAANVRAATRPAKKLDLSQAAKQKRVA